MRVASSKPNGGAQLGSECCSRIRLVGEVYRMCHGRCADTLQPVARCSGCDVLQGPTFGSPLAPIKSSFQTWSKPLAVYSLHFCSANDEYIQTVFLANAAQLRARAGAHAHQLLIHSVYGLGAPFAVTGPSSRFRHVSAAGSDACRRLAKCGRTTEVPK